MMKWTKKCKKTTNTTQEYCEIHKINFIKLKCCPYCFLEKQMERQERLVEEIIELRGK